MIRGGIAILDEGNRMSEKSWASLAPLLDNRRYVESIVAGIKIKAHPHFRLVATMNDDASTFELPEYIHSRLQPQIFIDFPERDEEHHILKENLPFAEERILSYVTDFLQMAHAADERYTVRDGINIGALRHQAEEPGHAAHARNRGPGDRHHPGAGRGSVALCPEKSTFRFLIRAASTRGRFTYFPVVPGRLEFAIEVRAAILRDRPEVVALELPVTLQPAWMRAVARLPEISVIFYPDESAGDDQAVYVPIEPADPFTEAIRTGLEIGAEIVFADPDAGQRPHLKDAYPDTYAVRHIGLERYIEAYRVYPQPRSDEIAAPRRRDRLETAGRQSAGRRAGGGLAQPARPRAGRHGGAPGAAPGAHPPRRHRAAQSASRIARPKFCSNIPPCSGATRHFRALMTDANLIDRRHAQLAVFRDAEKEYEANTGERIAHWQRRLLARYTRNLALAGATSCRPASSISPWPPAASPTTTTPGTSGRPPAAIRRRSIESDLPDRANLRRRGLDRHAPHPPAPPPAQHQAEAAARTASSRARRRSFPANGPAS